MAALLAELLVQAPEQLLLLRLADAIRTLLQLTVVAVADQYGHNAWAAAPARSTPADGRINSDPDIWLAEVAKRVPGLQQLAADAGGLT